MSSKIVVCKTCNGTGIEYDGAGHTCTACNGIAAPVVERPEPVAVVLSGRMREDPHDEHQPVSEYHAECGWNACLDKVKELNQ